MTDEEQFTRLGYQLDLPSWKARFQLALRIFQRDPEGGLERLAMLCSDRLRLLLEPEETRQVLAALRPLTGTEAMVQQLQAELEQAPRGRCYRCGRPLGAPGWGNRGMGMCTDCRDD